MVRICKCGHSEEVHNRKSCKGITTQSHKGLDWSKCKCKGSDIIIDTSLPNIHLE